MKNWKRLVLISLLIIILSAVLCGIFNNDETRLIWNISKIILILSALTEIISIVGYWISLKHNNEKKPMWFVLLLCLIGTISVLVVMGKISQKDYEKSSQYSSQQYQQYWSK